MKYVKKDNEIIIEKQDFNIVHILECGQVFSYKKINNDFVIYSADKKATVKESNNKYIIETNDIDYFINYFDLDTDYTDIKNALYKYDFMRKSIDYGNGIRILKQDLLETIISFVISANNNIKRIQNSVFYIRENVGEKRNDYYAFPSLDKLKMCDEAFFINAGLGYRAKQIVKLCTQLNKGELEKSKVLDTESLRSWLISLSGIGPKVADCILLFAYSKIDVFPVDTWIAKVFNDHFYSCDNRSLMRTHLLKTFGSLSGYAQQYLFYYKRENGKNH